MIFNDFNLHCPFTLDSVGHRSSNHVTLNIKQCINQLQEKYLKMIQTNFGSFFLKKTMSVEFLTIRSCFMRVI